MTDPATRPDAASAALAARAQHRQVEVTNATTETVRRWANPDGTFTDEQYAGPVRVRRGADWVPIDTTLRIRDGKVRTAATVGDVTFSGGGVGALATMAQDGVAFSLSVPGGLPVPVIDGAKATYAGVMPGVDVELTARPSGFEQSFILRSRVGVRNAFHLTRTVKGLTPAAREGRLVYVDAHGTTRVWVGAARMWDATGREAKVEVTDVAVGGGRALRMTPDAAFLADSSVVFPVTVDPTVQLFRWIDAYIDSVNNTTNYGGNAYLKIGKRTSSYVSYIAFTMSAYAGKHITDVTQNMGTVDSVTCSARTTTIYKVTTSWSPSTVTWASHPTTDLTSGGVLATATSAGGGPVGSACAANAWMGFRDARLTAMYDDWANSRTPNYGMSIRSSDTDTTAAKDFASGENGSWTPRVTVTYNNAPQQPKNGDLSIADPGYYDAVTSTSYVNDATPTLRGSSTDQDGQQTRVDYEIWQNPMSVLVATSATDRPLVPNGTVSEWTVPTALPDRNYYWRARGFDGTDYSPWSVWQGLYLDTIAPPSYTVSSTAYPAGSWSGADGQAGSFNLGPAPVSALRGYYYGLDEPTPSTFTTVADVSLTPAEGPHTLYVQSADWSGNRSPVTAYSFSVGDVGVTSPRPGARTEKTLTLTAAAKPAWTSATWKWRRSDADGWTPLTGLKDLSGNDVSQPMAVSSGDVPAVTWDAESAVQTDGPFQLAIDVDAGGPTVTSRTVPVALARNDVGSVTATEQLPVGTVNLQTGNLQLGATDVSVDTVTSDLSVTRTFNSRDSQADPNGAYGPGWVSSVPVAAAGSDFRELTVDGSLVTVALADGDSIGFTKTAVAGVLEPEYGAEGLTLSYVTLSDRYDLTDDDGDVTSFTKPAGALSYVPTSVTQSGDTTATTYAYETTVVDGKVVTRVTGVMAPSAPGITGCTLVAPSAVVGCESLTLTYFLPATVAPSPGQHGDYPNRLAKIELVAYDPDQLPSPGMRSVELAHFAYDSNGRLAEAWDARLPNAKTLYTYNAAGQVETVTEPGEEAWTIAYADRTGETDAGRVRSVSRPTLLASPSTATTTVVYGVPVSGSGAPWDLGPATLDRTGQADRPTTATAVFPPNTTASPGTDANALPGSYDRADVHYLDAAGREVNTADPSGAVSTTEYDARGALVRSLMAGNRQRAFDRGQTTAEEAAIAETLTSRNVYSADGLELRETYGPEHEVALKTGEIVRARTHTTRTYDEGAPGGATYHLQTTVTTSARVLGESTDRGTESRTTKVEYGTTAESWERGLPTASIVDAVSGGLNAATRMTYTAEGRLRTMTAPAGGTTTTSPSTRVTWYYTAGTSADDAVCGNKPEWSGRVCAVAPGGQPATGPQLPTTFTTYDMFGSPRVVTEKLGASTLRTRTITYDAAGRTWRVAVSASTGTAVPTNEMYYDAAGRATETRSIDAVGTVTARVTRVFDTLGRLTSYTDADGSTATTTYDVLSRRVTTNDGKGTQTWAYDEGAERRGLATSLTDSHAGVWSATYDAAGTPTITLPNALRAATTVDETGEATSLTYARTSGCTDDCVWLSFAVHQSVHGQWTDQKSTLSAQDYTYDAAGRLTEVEDLDAGACTTRRYTYDAGGSGNSNRTKYETLAAAADGACQGSTVASTVTSTYDTADRLGTSGTVYDALGRTTTVPDADALDAGALTIAYHANDLVRSISRAGGGTNTYTLDVDQQRIRSWTDAAGVHTNHFDGDGDSPAWTQESATAWTRAIGDLGGDLGATYDSATGATTLRLANLHGDIVATASTSTSATGPTSTFEATEFGIPRGATGTRYGWLGAKQRAADTPGGLSLMGVRLYNPASGRFLQVDPEIGGSANAYDYADQDPLNSFDLDGRMVAHADACSSRCEAAMNRHYIKHPYRPYHPPAPKVRHEKKCGRFNPTCFAKKHYKSIVHHAINIGISVAAGAFAAAVCGATAGLGCVVMAGAVAGLSLSPAHFFAAHFMHEKVTPKKAGGWIAGSVFAGATAGLFRGGTGRGKLTSLLGRRVKPGYPGVRSFLRSGFWR